MPPKKATPTAVVFVVLSSNGTIDSVHATSDSANTRLSSVHSAKIEEYTLVHGSVLPDPEAAPAKAPARGKSAPIESKEDPYFHPPRTTKGKLSNPPAEAANKPAKNAADESSLPENVQALLNGSGNQFAGMAICVTGVPSIMGRKNAEKLVTSYGGKLAKSLSKNTQYVVIGRDAGPKKMDQIEELGLETLDEEQFIELLESGGGGGAKNGASAKRVASGDGEKAAKKKK